MKHFFVGFSLFASIIFSKAQVSIQVSIPPIVPNSEITIVIKINKGSVTNFAKYQIDVPPGVYLSEGDNKTGSFSFENNRAKVIWVSIPTEPEFTITMKLNPGTATGMGTINQKFYYLDNGTRKEVEAVPITLDFSGGPGITTTNKSPANSEPPPPSSPATTSAEIAPVETASPVVAAPEPTVEVSTAAAGNTIVEHTPEVTATESVSPVTKPKENPAESIKRLKEQFDAANAPEEVKKPEPVAKPAAVSAVASGVSYKIQIGAYGENPGMGRYKSLKGVTIVKEDSFYKILVGNFKNREDATRKKEELAAKGFKGFIVTYQGASRVK